MPCGVGTNNVEFIDCKFNGCVISSTSFNDIDLSSCSIDGIMIDLYSIKGATINDNQAIQLVSLLGVKVK